MKQFILSLLLCLAFGAQAAGPYLNSDPDPTGAMDKCVWQEGANAPVETPTVAIAPSTIVGSCHIDVAPFTAGVHQLQVWFKSTLWGVVSGKSPFTFTKPNATASGPQNLQLVP